MIRNVTVFCASSPTGPRADEYFSVARIFGSLLADAGLVCLNGGSHGLMTELSRAAHAHGGDVHCLTQGDQHIDHDAFSFHEHFPTLSLRQAELLSRADAYVALPGGIGTHYEIFEVLCRKMMGDISPSRPLICIGDTYRDLQNLLRGIVESGLSFADPYAHISFVETPQEAVQILISLKGA